MRVETIEESERANEGMGRLDVPNSSKALSRADWSEVDRHIGETDAYFPLDHPNAERKKVEPLVERAANESEDSFHQRERDTLVQRANEVVARATGERIEGLADRIEWVPPDEFDRRLGQSDISIRQTTARYFMDSGRIEVRDDPHDVYLDGTLSHEALHMYREEYGGGELPLWINEGITQHLTETYDGLAGNVVRVEKSLDGSITRVEIPRFDEAVDVRPDFIVMGTARSYPGEVNIVRELEALVSRPTLVDYWKTGDDHEMERIVDRHLGAGSWQDFLGFVGGSAGDRRASAWTHTVARQSLHDRQRYF